VDHVVFGSVIFDMVFLAGCIPALKLIETWGRRPLITAVLTAIGFFVCLFMAEETKGMTLAQAGGKPEAADTKEEPALQAK
jgi:ABC-type uncharacterized transport system permease subunit